MPGDDILVDLGDCEERLRDGIYVLRADDALVVKRLALHPAGRRVTVQSDNPAYPDWPDCEHRRDQLHRPGDLGRAGRSASSAPRAVDQPQQRPRAAMPRPVPISMPFIGLPIASPTTAPTEDADIRKNPPAIGVRFAMGAHGRAGGCSSSRPNMVNVRLTSFVGSRERGGGLMAAHGHRPSSMAAVALAEASELMIAWRRCRAGGRGARRTQPRRRQCPALLPLAADRAGDRDAVRRRSARDHPLRA